MIVAAPLITKALLNDTVVAPPSSTVEEAIVNVSLLSTPLFETINVPASNAVPPVYVLPLFEKLTIPLFIESPTTSAPEPAPEMMPLKVTVRALTTAILLVPVIKEILLLIVLLPVTRSVPPASVAEPEDRFVPLAPPELIDNVPALILVPPD